MQCPRHDRAMRRFAIDGVEVDRCGICGGIWLDAGELAQLVALDKSTKPAIRMLDRSDDADEPADHDAVCPRDGTALIRMRDVGEASVECDACSACGGVFLDAGGLSGLTEDGLIARIRRFLPGQR